MSTILALFGLIIFFIGLSKLKQGLDKPGKEGVKLLMIVAVLAIIQSLSGYLPFVEGIFGSIIHVVTIFLFFFGWIKILDGIFENAL